MSLALNQWERNRYNILMTGPTGAGKSYLACALAQKACRDGNTTLYQRVPRLLQEIAIARLDGRFAKLIAPIFKCRVLILDDLLISPLLRSTLIAGHWPHLFPSDLARSIQFQQIIFADRPMRVRRLMTVLITKEEQQEFLEIVEERYDRKATIVTSQLPV